MLRLLFMICKFLFLYSAVVENRFTFLLEGFGWLVIRDMSAGIHLTPPPKAGCITRSIFKWRKAGLNSEFSIS